MYAKNFFIGVFSLFLFLLSCNTVCAMDVVENDSESILESETIDQEIVLESYALDQEIDPFDNSLIFTSLDFGSDGVTLKDVYNVLVLIYNFLLMCFVVALMIWTYHMVTSAFRRFIYR